MEQVRPLPPPELRLCFRMCAHNHIGYLCEQFILTRGSVFIAVSCRDGISSVEMTCFHVATIVHTGRRSVWALDFNKEGRCFFFFCFMRPVNVVSFIHDHFTILTAYLLPLPWRWRSSNLIVATWKGLFVNFFLLFFHFIIVISPVWGKLEKLHFVVWRKKTCCFLYFSLIDPSLMFEWRWLVRVK